MRSISTIATGANDASSVSDGNPRWQKFGVIQSMRIESVTTAIRACIAWSPTRQRALTDRSRIRSDKMTPMLTPMLWGLSHRADARALPLADRHYNRQKIGSPQFVPPGRCLVLLTPNADALWVTSAPFGQYVQHAWPGAWVCSLFRNESPLKGRHLIRQAVAVTRWYAERQGWETPSYGMVSFVDARYVRPKRDLGHTYIMAGFRPAGRTKSGLIAMQMLPERMPPARAPLIRLPSPSPQLLLPLFESAV